MCVFVDVYVKIPCSFYYCCYTYYTNNIVLFVIIIRGVNNELYSVSGSGHPGHLLLFHRHAWLYDVAIIYNIGMLTTF